MTPALPNDHMQVLMYKLAMAGLEIPVGPSYDPDAEAYFARAGVTDAASKDQINQRILGLKNLGFWNFLVEEWPMRTSQNIGSGSIAYGIKGFSDAQFNGSSWSSDYVRLDSGSHITLIPSYEFQQGVYLTSVHSVDSVSSNNRGIDASTVSIAGGMWCPLGGGDMYFDCLNQSTSRIFGSSGVVNNQINMFAGSSNGMTAWVNKSSKASGGSPDFPEARIIDFGKNPNNPPSFVGNLYCVSVFDVSLFNQVNHDSNYELYKSTIGQGLGLP